MVICVNDSCLYETTGLQGDESISPGMLRDHLDVVGSGITVADQ